MKQQYKIAFCGTDTIKYGWSKTVKYLNMI